MKKKIKKNNEWITAPCAQPDQTIRATALERQGQLTKPPGSLGRLEKLAVELAALQGCLEPSAEQIQITVFAADHGVVEAGVSAFPQAVTTEMVKNFMRGGAAINVLADMLAANLSVVNAGTIAKLPFGGDVIDSPVSYGTRNMLQEAAMTNAELTAALLLGRNQIDACHKQRVDMVIGGEMGIGNTTAATALSALLTDSDPALLTGPGTGLDAEGIRQKQMVIARAIEAAHKRCPDELDAVECLRQLGGYEIAALVGYYIRAAQVGLPILVDGFIASAAALVACRMNAAVRDWMLFAHASAEPGHATLMKSLVAQPVLDLGMRLGEGSGAALAVFVLRAACTLHNRMATFAEAGVSAKIDS